MNTFCFTETPQTKDSAVFSIDEYNRDENGIPRIEFAATWPDDENSKIVSLLERSQGKTVYVDSIDFSGHPFPEFRAVEDRCYSDGMVDVTKLGALSETTIYVPVPAGYYIANKKHLFFNPETYQGYLCEFGVRFEFNEPQQFAYSSGGTGILTLHIAKKFRVSVLVSGINTIFHLREVSDSSSSKSKISNKREIENSRGRLEVVADSCSLPNGNTTYQQESDAWLELLPAVNLKSSDRLFVCPDFKKALDYPLHCLKSETKRAIFSWKIKLACD